MNKLTITKQDTESGTLISPPHCDTKLICIDLDSYAVVVNGSEHPIYAFRSTTFSGVLNDLVGKIKDISLNFLLPFDHELETGFAELRIFKETGEVLIFDSSGQLGILTGLSHENSKKLRAAVPATEQWNLPEDEPYRRLLFSKDIIAELTEVMEQQTPKVVVDRIWADFKRTNHSLTFGQVACVNGEFAFFCITALRCGRFVIMTFEEGMASGSNTHS